ncbi:MAG: excinuclease ABC subunit UvrC, partial [Actinobacteria bacterium]|nr:excinuclease ABC subunit UvrC [Actinomycetota bacterium]
MTADWHPEPRSIPTDPGVYRFYDENNRILYVGKAKVLRNRLSTYFHNPAGLMERTARMVKTARRVDWTVVGSELEALHLEFTWIKEFRPPFNIQFRDDKGYPYLAVSMGEEYPRAFLARTRVKDGTVYFGPFTKSWAVRETLDLLLSVYPVRSCEKSTFAKARRDDRPCLLGDIGKCAAPCVGRVTTDEHRELAINLVGYMNRQDSAVIDDLGVKMKDASARHDFESAARFRDQRSALRSIAERSAIVLRDELDVDIIGFASSELSAAIAIFHVRGGRVRGTRSWTVDTELEMDAAAILEQAIENVYELDAPPALIDVPFEPQSSNVLSESLTLRRANAKLKGKVRIGVPQRGDRATLLTSVTKNAMLALGEHELHRAHDFVARSRALEDLRDNLALPEAPLRFECCDISHLGGTDIVGSLVVFEDGLPVKDDYRHYGIASARDDTEAMYQLISRRLVRLAEERPAMRYPTTLILVDGGQPQVNAAARALRESGIDGVAVVGLAKRLEELWHPNSDFPVILPRDSDALYLVQRARDEAHRFALRYQKSKRTKVLTSTLNELDGIGPKRVQAL